MLRASTPSPACAGRQSPPTLGGEGDDRCFLPLGPCCEIEILFPELVEGLKFLRKYTWPSTSSGHNTVFRNRPVREQGGAFALSARRRRPNTKSILLLSVGETSVHKDAFVVVFWRVYPPKLNNFRGYTENG